MSVNQKIIMEGWRDWLAKTFIGGEDPDPKKDLAMDIRSSMDYIEIILYMPNKMKEGKAIINKGALPIVVSMVRISRLTTSETPCIPSTWHITAVATSKEFQSMGFGTLIYDIAATYAKSAEYDGKGGITSDHNTLTTIDGARRWDKIDKDSNYIKKETSKKNDTFDYTGEETPDDEDDDCRQARTVDAVVDHSYMIVNGVEQEMEELTAKHEKYIQSLKGLSAAEFQGILNLGAAKVFRTAFHS